LSGLAKAHGIPLILDNAYGAPFPGIIFTDAQPFWEPHVILTYSLSKIGLPGTRTGIVIGPPEISAHCVR
jgi:valine--pyruvate aminotransferase